jgi:AcrR family transcriptional regulator
VVHRSSRDAVLDAVTDSVRTVGVRRTTLAEVARRAGIARSTVYTHVADVTEAAAAALTRELVRLLGDAMATLRTGRLDARAQVVEAGVHLARHVPRDPLFERILDLDGELLVPYLTTRLGSSQRTILDTVTALVEQGQRDGSIRAGEPERIAFTTFLVAQAFTVSARIAAETLGEDAALDELARVLDATLAPDRDDAA